MSIPINELSETDYKLLKYVSKFKSISKNQIQQHFSKEAAAMDYHLSLLKQPLYKESGHGFHIPIENTSYIAEEFNTISDQNGVQRYISNDSFHITDLGRSALQELQQKAKFNRKNTLLKSVWIPIAVSIITSLIIDGLESLFPLIRQWLSYILK